MTAMINNFFESLEDPDKPLLGPNEWIMKKIGLILPQNKFKKAIYIFIHELGTFFVITQYMELYAIKSDLDDVITNMKISMLSIVCVIKSNATSIWQDRWIQVLDYITEADKYERENQDKIRENIINKYTKYCRRVSYLYWALVFTTFLTVTHTPLVRYVSSSTYREELRNGTELFPHIFSSWMPVDKYSFPGCWITVMWHIYICAYGASVVAAFDSSAIVIMVFFGGKLELLRERCKLILGSKGNEISENEATIKIRQLHDIHVALTRYSRMFNSVLSPVMFLYVVMCSLMLCASAFQLTAANNNATQQLLNAEYFIFGVSQLFLYCWHSNDVLVKSQNVIYGPYESDWWRVNVRQRKHILMLAGQFKTNHVFTAGPFTDLTLSSFITILKGAYSYYTLLRK